jgi:transcriptional regulator with XRE-family HTH domain
VRTLRDKRSWTQEDLADQAGLDRSYVSGLESGRRNPTYLRLLALAKAFTLPIQTLLDIEK